MIAERVERRVLGAIYCLNSLTGLPILRPIELEGSGIKFLRNRSGYYVILKAAGFEEYSGVFNLSHENPPVEVPPSQEFSLTVRDPIGQFLPQKVSFSLPRSTEPQNINAEDSVFKPIYVHLFSSPIARPATNWAVLRASFKENTALRKNPPSLPWAMVEITPHENSVLANQPLPENIQLHENDNILHLTEFHSDGSIKKYDIELTSQQSFNTREDLKNHIQEKVNAAETDNEYEVTLVNKNNKLRISRKEESELPIQIKAYPTLGFLKDTPMTIQSIADHRGEALIALPGLPAMRVANTSDGSLTTDKTEATVCVFFDADWRKKGYVPNPDDLEKPSVIKAATTYSFAPKRETAETFLMRLSEPATLELLRDQQ